MADSFSDIDNKKTKAYYSNDEEELLLPSLPPYPSEDELPDITTTKNRGLLDFDSDCESLDSLPSASEFFDQLLTQKRDTPVVEIDDDDDDVQDYRVEEAPLIDRKGKRKAYESTESSLSTNQRRRFVLSDNDQDEEDWTTTLSTKEKKTLEAEQRKRRQAEAAEEKKRRQAEAAEEKRRKKAEALEEKKRLKEQKQVIYVLLHNITL
jgi:hypothetical protein